MKNTIVRLRMFGGLERVDLQNSEHSGVFFFWQTLPVDIRRFPVSGARIGLESA